MDEERLDRIENNLTLLLQETRTANQALTRHDRALYGPTGTTGMVRTVDRLDQAEKRRAWHLKTLWGAIVGLAGTYAASLFSGKP